MIFPIGHYVGVIHPRDGVHHVRVGRERHELTEDEFTLWVLAHGVTGAVSWTREDVLRHASRVGLEVADHLGPMVARGLAVEPVDPVAFAGAYRLRPLLVGLGNTVAEPDLHAIGIPGLPPVGLLDPESYELWQWGHLAPTLWRAAEVFAEVEDDGDPVTALDRLLGRVRVLLACGGGYLDRAA